MAQLTHVETIHGPLTAYGADIRDLSVVDTGSGLKLTVFAGASGSARNVEFDVSNTTSYQTQYALGSGSDGFVALDFGATTLNLSASRVSAALGVAPGDTGDAINSTALNSGLAADMVTTLGVNTGSSSFLIATTPDKSGLASFQLQPDGSLTLATALPETSAAAVSDLATVTCYGKTWVIGSSVAGDSVESYTIDAAGALTHQTSFGAADGLGVNTPTGVSPVMMNGQPYIILGSSDSASLSVLRLEADGSFTPTDHVLDDLGSRFDTTGVIETLQIGDTSFVLAAGSDDGFSLFKVLPDGTLHHLSSFEDTNSTTLQNVSAATMVQDGTNLRIFVSSSTESGLSHFRYDLSNLGSSITGTNSADTLVGTALDDVLLGADGDDTLSGGAGDDLLVDGAGSDILLGGQGADVFTFHDDGATDVIQDFERGVDRLDLSHYPLVHDVSALGYTKTATGARLTIRGDTLNIFSSDGTSLSLADLTATSPFNTDRPPLVLSTGGGPSGGGQTQVGTAADDSLVGTTADDILTGNGGDDLLSGGAGADALYGGLGQDTADYSTATTGVTVNLGNMSLNTGDAAGDQYFSIEVISGSGFADVLSGTSGADTLYGKNGADRLDGGSGADHLDGGSGDDILTGGAGADILQGGDQTDTSTYLTAANGLRVDLAYGSRNTGDGAGDILLSIESIEGSTKDDWLYGDAGRNTVSGNSGADWLFGRSGDDILTAGSGNDVLDGGGGADTLNGGTGTDRAQYMSAKSGVTASLSNPSRNTGDAAGDSYISIEDLAGSVFADTLEGNAADNMLMGNSGNDHLNGAAGNDILIGGRGADHLTGGAGDDTLIGGIGDDHFVFDPGFGADVVKDFSAGDTLELDTALLGATLANAQDVLADFATVTASGVLIDFGAGDTILLEHLTDLSSLSDAFLFV
ncbi:MAG: calcium-binding protein [Marinosulfonomonas sp.]